MTRLESQIRELSPSVKDALFRRLTFAEDLAWLRDEKKKDMVIGFEVDPEGQELSGFALIAIQKHTVIAFVSDRDESPRLILFPSLETLFDPGFELLDLIVTRKEYRDAAFQGISTGHGRFGDMVKDLTPPERKMDLAETVIEQMANSIRKEEEAGSGQPATDTAPPVSVAPVVPPVRPEYGPAMEEMEEPGYTEGSPDGYGEEPEGFDGYEEPGYDDYEGYSEPYEEPYDEYADDGYQEDAVPEKEPSRSEKLKAQEFKSLSEVTDFVVMKLGVNRPLAVTLANKAMQSKVSPEYRVQLAVNIFCKLMDENKI